MTQMTEEQRKALEEKVKNMSPEELKEFQKQQCIFCQIIAGKIPSKKIYEDGQCIAVMDVNPAALGHVLLLPKEHYSILPQIPEKDIGHLFMVAKHISQAILRKLKVDGTNIFVANGFAAGQNAQHAMIHIIPRTEGDNILEFPEQVIEIEMREKIAEVIQKRINQLLGIKKETQKKLSDESVVVQDKKEITDDEKQFITSRTAKRYHKSNCAFAQNISEENRVHLSKKEAEQSERKPCTCVTGEKIPIKNKPKKSLQKKEVKKTDKKEEGVSLDDIAGLFK